MSGVGDSFTERTHTSWFSRIGKSIVAVLFGLILLVGSSVLLFWNEGRAVQTERSLAEGRGLVVTVEPARVDPANEGKLVHVNGEVKAVAPLRDPEFRVAVTALRLIRTVEMYQWKEEEHTQRHTTLGGSEDSSTTYTYHLTWNGSRIDSSHFRRPDGHDNPQMRYTRTTYTARDATLGAFRPSEPALRLLPANQMARVAPAHADTLRGRISGPLQVTDGRIYLGVDPGQPHIGDHRISFSTVPNGPASFIGRQSGADFAEYQTQSGDKLLMARSGLMSAPEMFKVAEDENRMLTWLLRAVGLFVMFIGFALVLFPLSVIADFVPFIGSIVGRARYWLHWSARSCSRRRSSRPLGCGIGRWYRSRSSLSVWAWPMASARWRRAERRPARKRLYGLDTSKCRMGKGAQRRAHLSSCPAMTKERRPIPPAPRSSARRYGRWP